MDKLLPSVRRVPYSHFLNQNPYEFKLGATSLLLVPGLRLWEDPEFGEDVPVLASLNGYVWSTGFYDPWNQTDIDYINDQARLVFNGEFEWQE